MQKEKSIKVLTEGNPTKLLLSFSIPFILCNLIQNLYTIFDSMVVGKLIGSSALGAIGSVSVVYSVLVSFINGLAAGPSIPISKYLGKNDDEKIRKSIGNSLWFILFFVLFFTIALLILKANVLDWMNCPSEFRKYGDDYLSIMSFSIIFSGFSTLAVSIINSTGNSKITLIFLLISGLIKLLLNFVFVLLGLEIWGTGISTILSNLFTIVACLIYIYKNIKVIIPNKNELFLKKIFLKEHFQNGVPIGLQYSIAAMGTLIRQGIVNTLGASCILGLTASGQLLNIPMGLACSIASAITIFTAQNLGANKCDRIRKGMKVSALMVTSLTLVFIFSAFFFGRSLCSIFIDNNEPELGTIMDYGAYSIRLMSLAFIFVSFAVIYRSAVQGLGYTKTAVIGGILELAVQSLIAILTVNKYGFYGVVWSQPACWISVGILFPILFYIFIRKIELRKGILIKNENECKVD